MQYVLPDDAINHDTSSSLIYGFKKIKNSYSFMEMQLKIPK